MATVLSAQGATALAQSDQVPEARDGVAEEAPAPDTTADEASATDPAAPVAFVDDAAADGAGADEPPPAEPGPSTPASAEPVRSAPAHAPEQPPQQSWTDLVEIHGFGVLWLTPLHDPTVPGWVERPGVDTFHFRFARILLAARPTPDFLVSANIAIENPNPFFNYELTWKGLPYVNVTAGQMRIPFGASIRTPAPALVLWDRPRFMYVMSKEAFRDIGVLIHSPRAGLFDGTVEYHLGMFNGSGRARAGMPILDRDFHEYLFVARLAFNAAPLLSMPNESRLALGASYAHSVDPASTTPDAAQASADAVHFLGGSLAPFMTNRETQLVGADLTLSAFDMWVQAEIVYLRSAALDGSASTLALGASVEVGYTIRAIFLQPAARFEYFDPDFETGGRSAMIFSVGANFDITSEMRLSAFYSHDRYAQMGADFTDNRIRARFMIRF